MTTEELITGITEILFNNLDISYEATDKSYKECSVLVERFKEESIEEFIKNTVSLTEGKKVILTINGIEFV